MKFICLDYNNCGYTENIKEPEKNAYCIENTCPDCLGVAVLFDKNYKPIFNKTNEEVDALLATIANMLNQNNEE
tara:strand:+ start:1613 stop:1834 length:222 start_codon:yes stop_codon:yes gene_type:complete